MLRKELSQDRNRIKLLLIIVLCNLIVGSLYAQVGINTETPKVTLDVTGFPLDNQKTDGVLIPRMTLGQLNAKNALYAEPETGTLNYVTYVGDGTPAGKTADVLRYGFYYYDYWNEKGQRWTRLNDTPLRHTYVTVGAGKMYSNLQNAFNQEAKSIYDQSGAPVEFLCSGEVGGLNTDGSIPYIRIKSDGTMTCSDKGLTFYNTTVDMDGNIDVKNNDVILYSSNIVLYKNAELKGRGLTVDKSSFKAFFGGNKIKFGSLTSYNGYVAIEGNSSAPAELDLVGNQGVTYLVLATRGSYISLSQDLTVNFSSSEDIVTSIEASYGSTVHCQNIGKIAFNNTYKSSELTYDFRSRINGTIILEYCTDITGTSLPDFFTAADHQSSVLCYQSKVKRTVRQIGFSSLAGSSISIVGENTDISLKGPGTPFSVGMVAANGNIYLSGIMPSNPLIVLENFEIGLKATQGGTINAMGKIKRDTNITQANVPLIIGTPSKTGAVIYDSVSED